MSYDIIGGLVSFFAGISIAFVNYLISKKAMKNTKLKMSVLSFARQLIQIIFLFAAFVIGRLTLLNEWYLIIGGALGITLPMIFLTTRLVALNKDAFEKIKEKEENSNG